MNDSFEKINYNLRPNKSIERKMMCEALSRLSFIEHLDDYRYIGFGSTYFTDFTLFHKALGIKDLISIELAENKRKRFDFNLPYSGIKMKYGHSNTILPNLELHKKKNILWLDYDKKISDFMLTDVNTFFFNAVSGSFFILSVTVEADLFSTNTDPEISAKQFRMSTLIDRCGKSKVPMEFMDLNLTTTNLTKVTYEIINRQIASTLNNRNGRKVDKLEYKQLFNFVYKDNATILTIGGILFDDSHKSQIDKMKFSNLPFVRNGKEQYKIMAPNLTLREIKALDKILPDPVVCDDQGIFLNEKFNEIPLIAKQIKDYARIYRYYPNYTETNL